MNRRMVLPLAGLSLAAMVLAAVLGTSPVAAQASPPASIEAGAGDDGCDPEIREALAASAARGVESGFLTEE